MVSLYRTDPTVASFLFRNEKNTSDGSDVFFHMTLGIPSYDYSSVGPMDGLHWKSEGPITVSLIEDSSVGPMDGLR